LAALMTSKLTISNKALMKINQYFWY
jgi:hypothetical protein